MLACSLDGKVSACSSGDREFILGYEIIFRPIHLRLIPRDFEVGNMPFKLPQRHFRGLGSNPTATTGWGAAFMAYSHQETLRGVLGEKINNQGRTFPLQGLNSQSPEPQTDAIP